MTQKRLWVADRNRLRRTRVKRIDLHVHAKLSKTFPYDPVALGRTIAQAKRVGLDGLALTPHLHTVDFWGMYERLCATFPHQHGVLLVDDGFGVLTGAADDLTHLAHGLSAGVITLVADGRRCVFRPSSPLELRLAAKHKRDGDKSRLSLRLTWRVPPGAARSFETVPSVGRRASTGAANGR